MKPEEAIYKLNRKPVTFAILDIDLGSPEMNGITLGIRLKDKFEDLIVIIMTGYHNINLAVDAMRSHDFDYMIKPFRIDQVISLMERCEREMLVRRENRNLKSRIADLEAKIGKLEEKLEVLMPSNAGLQSKKMESAKVQSERAVRSYQKQK
jgi:DNA-binding NtrC family response regulator